MPPAPVVLRSSVYYFLRSAVLAALAIAMGPGLGPASLYAQEAFVTIWDTENPGASSDTQLIVPGTGSSYTIAWEEVGAPSNSGQTTATDTDTLHLPRPGRYRISISGDFTRIRLGESSDPRKIERVVQWGDIAWSTMREAFAGAANLTLAAPDTPDLSDVTSMKRMFYDASGLTAPNSRIGDWDVSGVTDMDQLFREAHAFNQDVGGWNVSNVTTMYGLFSQAHSFNQDISDWDVSGVENMELLFFGAESFNQDIGDWDLSSAVSTANMFRDAHSFNQDLSGWDVSGVENMGQMFRDARSFDQDIGNWAVSGVTNMYLMFGGAESFAQELGAWDISNVSNIQYMFDGTALSPQAYDRTLVGWAQQAPRRGVSVRASGVRYCDSGPFRTHLREGFNWTLGDAGAAPDCPDDLSASGAREVAGDGAFAFDSLAATLVLSGVSDGGRITAARYEEAPRAPTGISEDNVSTYRFVVAGGGVAFDSAEVRIAVEALDGLDAPAAATVYGRSRPGRGAFAPLETRVDDNGTPDTPADDTLSATIGDTLGEFVLASSSDPLPVSLAHFDARATAADVRLTWRTASETNSAGFAVQHRPPRQPGWTSLGFVESSAPSGTSAQPHTYAFSVTDVAAGTHRFRLRQVDLDGSSRLTDPVSVAVRPGPSLRLSPPSPNPVSGTATVSFTVPTETRTTVTVYNVLGQRVATLYEGRPSPQHAPRLRLDASALPSGTYVLQLRAGGETRTQRMAVVH